MVKKSDVRQEVTKNVNLLKKICRWSKKNQKCSRRKSKKASKKKSKRCPNGSHKSKSGKT